MPHTHTKHTAAEQAEATEKWLDNLDPAQLDFRDAIHVRAIIAAAGVLATAEENLRKAVAEARVAWGLLDRHGRRARDEQAGRARAVPGMRRPLNFPIRVLG